MNNKQLLRFEVMDRASVQIKQLEAALVFHEGLTPRTAETLTAALDALHNLYQVAAEEFDKAY